MIPKCPFCGKKLVRVAAKGKAVPPCLERDAAAEILVCWSCKKWQESGFKLMRG